MKNFKEFVVITLATILAASAIFFFMMPNNVIVAGAAGLAVMFDKLIPISVSAWTMIFNVICLILAALFVGKEFTGKTIYISLLLPIVIKVYEVLLPDFQSITGDYVLDMVCYLFFVSLAIAILFMSNASSGGTDIPAKILNKYLKIDLGASVSAVGLCIIAPSFYIYGIKTGVLAIIATYANGVLIDHFIFGFNSRKKVCIISDRFEEIRDYITEKMNCDATIYSGTGSYKNKSHPELQVIVDRAEYTALMNYIQKTDADAFITVYTVREAIYKPKVKEFAKGIEK